MTIIRELDKNNIIKPITRNRVLEKLRHYVENARQLNGMVDYNLVKLRMLGSYDIIYDYSSNNDNIFPYSFLGQTIPLMTASSSKRPGAEDFRTFSTIEDKMISFRRDINLSSLSDDGDIVLEFHSEEEKVNMTPPINSKGNVFYMYIPITL